MSGKLWSNDDINELRRMFEGGFPRAQIAKRLNRTIEAVKHTAINLRLKRGQRIPCLADITLPGEQWRPAIGTYFVSSFGRVFGPRGRIISHWIDNDGYHHVTLRCPERKRYSVQRLVAFAFLSNPENFSDVCHNDGDFSNNSAANLRWDNHRGNCKDKYEHGTGSKHPRAKCTEAKALIVKQALASGAGITQAARLANVSFDIAYDIKRGRTWQ